MTAIKIKMATLSGTALVIVAAVPIVATIAAADSNEVKGPDGRSAKLERFEFQSAPVHYKYPPAAPHSRPPTEEVSRPEFRGEPLLSAGVFHGPGMDGTIHELMGCASRLLMNKAMYSIVES